VAIPLGLIGVGLALFAFRSTLSLNSALGVILLNGIAVANSILLVDLLKRLVARGLSPRAAAREAARQRLRPILITSLTTMLGMLPIALGFGEGGRILQPLGIAVSGGLWVSMGLTLFLVPALQVTYLEYRQRRATRSESAALRSPRVIPVERAVENFESDFESDPESDSEADSEADSETRTQTDAGGHA
jgi:HAE1 family hydrophobic/amphiphilic exporter-1